MKTFVVTYTTNYGLSLYIINSESIDKAKEEALLNGAWSGFDIEELDTYTEGVVFKDWS